eukprot:UN25278
MYYQYELSEYLVILPAATPPRIVQNPFDIFGVSFADNNHSFLMWWKVWKKRLNLPAFKHLRRVSTKPASQNCMPSLLCKLQIRVLNAKFDVQGWVI